MGKKENSLFVSSAINSEVYASLRQTMQIYKLTHSTRRRIEDLSYSGKFFTRVQITRHSITVILSSN